MNETGHEAPPADDRAAEPAEPADDRAAEPADDRAAEPAEPPKPTTAEPAEPADDRAAEPAEPADDRAAEPAESSKPTTGESSEPAEPAEAVPPKPTTAGGGEVRRLAHAPGERYAAAAPTVATGPTRRLRAIAAIAVALGVAVATFVLTTFDIDPGLLVIGIAGGWLTGLAVTGGLPAGKGDDAGAKRAAASAILAALGVSLGLLADAIRAIAQGGVLLPWDYAIARFGWVAPASILLAAGVGALRGR